MVRLMRAAIVKVSHKDGGKLMVGILYKILSDSTGNRINLYRTSPD